MQRITLDSKALFDFDKADLKPEGKAAIDSQIVGKIAQVQKLEVVLVTGHTDRLGSEAYNQKLSERRANTVRDYLVSKGVDKAKIETIGMGEKQPVVQCSQKDRKALIECLAPNRRVEVQVKGETTEVEDSQVQTRKAPLARGFFSRTIKHGKRGACVLSTPRSVFVSGRCSMYGTRERGLSRSSFAA